MEIKTDEYYKLLVLLGKIREYSTTKQYDKMNMIASMTNDIISSLEMMHDGKI